MCKRSNRQTNNLRAHCDSTLQPVSVLETNRLEPTSYGECDDTLYERVIQGQQNVFTDSKGTKFPKEILPLLTPKNILCIGSRISADDRKNITQIFIFLN